MRVGLGAIKIRVGFGAIKIRVGFGVQYEGRKPYRQFLRLSLLMLSGFYLATQYPAFLTYG